ncbi:MAG: acylphosphatase [Methanothrix sp.]|jgi:acylphosphatase|nr:acylphosphatase [Methanothrix sp.]
MKQLSAYVSGNVQRVGYRARVIQLANGLGLKGFVENLNDERVRIIAEGEEEKLKLFEGAIDIKNSLIKVSSIEKEYSDAHGYFGGFYKLVGTGETDSRLDEGINVLKGMKDVLIQILNKQDETTHEIKETNRNLGSKMDQMLDKQDQMLDKQDQMLDKQDQMLDKQDQMLDKQDQMLGKQDETISGIKDINSKMDLTLNKQDRMLGKQDESISEIKDMNRSLNDKMDKVLDKSDILELKGDVADMKSVLRAKGII